MKSISRITLAGLLPLVLGGCVAGKVDRVLDEGAAAGEEEFKALLIQAESEPRKQLSWNEARRRMMRDNLGLQQSRQMLHETERQTKRQWLTLVPRTSAFLNVGQALTSLTNFDSDNLNASVVASFNIPNPFEFYGTLYGNALQVQNARCNTQLDERRAFSELYLAFSSARALREEAVAIERKRRAFSAWNSPDVSKALYGLAREKDALERRYLAHRGNVNQLLNTPGGNWDLTGGLPDISFRDRYRKLDFGGDFGRLALKLHAIRVESAILQTQRVKFRQWPSINFGLSNPPLYSSEGGNDFAGEDFTLFSGVNKSMDLTDVGGRESIQNAEQRLKFTRAQLRQGMEREGVRMIQLRQAYDQLLAEERRLRAGIKRLERPASSEADAVLGDLELRSQLELQLIQTKRQVEQLDLQLLIWDESYWNS